MNADLGETRIAPDVNLRDPAMRQDGLLELIEDAGIVGLFGQQVDECELDRRATRLGRTILRRARLSFLRCTVIVAARLPGRVVVPGMIIVVMAGVICVVVRFMSHVLVLLRVVLGVVMTRMIVTAARSMDVRLLLQGQQGTRPPAGRLEEVTQVRLG
ncbi:MAG: hypothetical protein ABI867_21350, partial [Kofleriaceae bacterium]